MGRVLLFGATGFTGRLTAQALHRAGVPLVLVSRSAERVTALAAELTTVSTTGVAPETAIADASDQQAIRRVIGSSDDVLLSTVGPFVPLGSAAVLAAISAGARYIDSTGEGPFIRRVFEEYGPLAQRTGATLLTAFGYDYVPGNLAGALALRDAERAGASVDTLQIGYFVRGALRMSSGTRASITGIMVERSHGFRRGVIVQEATGARTRRFAAGGRALAGLTIGSSEHFTLPRLAPTLRNVDVFLGWSGARTDRASRQARMLDGALSVPGARALVRRVMRSRPSPVTGIGPDAQVRAGASTLVIAEGFDASGTRCASVELIGPSPYDLTAELLTWAARQCLATPALPAGAVGPVDAFGLDVTERECAAFGLRRSP